MTGDFHTRADSMGAPPERTADALPDPETDANAYAAALAKRVGGDAHAQGILTYHFRRAMDHGWRDGCGKSASLWMHEQIVRDEQMLSDVIHQLEAFGIEADGPDWTPAQGVEAMAGKFVDFGERLDTVEQWLEAEAAKTDANAPMNQGTPESGEAAGHARGFARGLRAAANVLTNGIPTPEPDKWAVGTRVIARTDGTNTNAGTAGRIVQHGYSRPGTITVQWEGKHPSAATLHRDEADDALFVIPPEPPRKRGCGDHELDEPYIGCEKCEAVDATGSKESWDVWATNTNRTATSNTWEPSTPRGARKAAAALAGAWAQVNVIYRSEGAAAVSVEPPTGSLTWADLSDARMRGGD